MHECMKLLATAYVEYRGYAGVDAWVEWALFMYEAEEKR